MSTGSNSAIASKGEQRKVQVTGFSLIPLDISDFPTRHNYGLALRQQQIEQIIRKGGAASGLNAAMPPWGSVDGSPPLLTDAQIHAVAKYVHDLSQKK